MTAVALAASLVTASATAGEPYGDLLARWQARLNGGPALVRDDALVAPLLQAQARQAQAWLASMRVPQAALPLWDDAAQFAHPQGLLASACVTTNAARLAQMALAWGTPGTPSYHDAALGAAAVAGLDWLVRQHYSAGRAPLGNWWDWQIGAPLHLLNALAMLDWRVPPELAQRTLAAVAWFVPDPNWRTLPDGRPGPVQETGANRLDKALVAILHGMLARDGARIGAGRDAIGAALQVVDHGDGFYRDGSFVQHGDIAYTGSYGAVALADLARLLYLLDGSAWPLPDAGAGQALRWARSAFAPWLIDGAMPDALRGRKLSASELSDHLVGRGVIASLASLAQQAGQADAAALRAAIKGWMVRDHSFGPSYLGAPGGPGVAGLAPYELGLLQAIGADSGIPPAPEAPGALVFPAMDRALLRGAGFAAVLSMSSPRISAFEFGNGENLQGWWSGMGMLALYDADQSQYGHGYWAMVDPRRLPGTTTDHSGSGRPQEWHPYRNDQAWVGGAALGRDAALGMSFSLRGVTGSDLEGKKSWFLLGQRIVALGAGIRASAAGVETIVANRRLGDAAGAVLLVDGVALPTGAADGARWAHLADPAAGSALGMLFPQGAALRSERGERRGSWRDLNEQQSAAVLAAPFQSLAIAHGAAPRAAVYAYVLLPGASAQQTAAEAAAPALRIEANDEAVAAVADPARGVYAANLWRAGSAARAGRPYLQASGSVAVVLRQAGGQLELALADPARAGGVLELQLAQPVAALLEASPGVSVLALAPTLRLRIALDGTAGATLGARFRLPDAP